MILLAGGSGRLGRLLVDRLVQRGLPVRVLTREPVRGEYPGSELVTVIRGDVRDPQSLVRAAAGVDVVVSAVHGFAEPERDALAAVDRDGNAHLVEAAKAVSAEFVLLSTVGAAADSAMELFRVKHAAEQHATASAVATTIVRATAFLELWTDLLSQTVGRSGRPLVFGRGENPINFVSVADVAALVERAIIDPATRGQIFEIGGPENLTFNQLAQALQAAAGRPGAPRHVPRPMLQLMASTIGRVKPELGRQARAALVMDRADLRFDATSIHEVYPDLPSTSLADVLARQQPALSSRELPVSLR
jgi:uncharacterized protein YbjT (DUF2867 family)